MCSPSRVVAGAQSWSERSDPAAVGCSHPFKQRSGLENPFLHQILPPAFYPALTRSLNTSQSPFYQTATRKSLTNPHIYTASALIILSTSSSSLLPL